MDKNRLQQCFSNLREGKASLKTEYRNIGHDKTKPSCPDIFLLHISTNQKKKEDFTCLLFVFLHIFAPNNYPLPKK